MQITFASILLLVGVSTLTQTREFDLKGDILGESLAVFKMHHPDAVCERDSSGTGCNDYSASFAGHQPYLWYQKQGDCITYGCGLSAGFFHDKLTSITYIVSNTGLGGNILELLTKKFGKPSFGPRFDPDAEIGPELYADWENGTPTQRLTLTIDKLFHLKRITVMLFYLKNPANDDI